MHDIDINIYYYGFMEHKNKLNPPIIYLYIYIYIILFIMKNSQFMYIKIQKSLNCPF